MRKLIKFEFRKLLRSRYFYIILGVSLLLVILNGLITNLLASMAQELGQEVAMDAYSFAKSTLSSTFMLLVGIFVAIYACEDFSHGILKNVVGKGYAREKVLYSKYLVSLLGALFIALVSVLFGFLFGNILWGNKATSDNVAVIIIGQFVGLITYHALFFAIAYTIRKPGFAIAINVVAPTVLSLVFTLVDTGLQNAKIDFNITQFWVERLHTEFISVSGDSSIYGRNIAILLVYFAAAILIGFFANRKREIK